MAKQQDPRQATPGNSGAWYLDLVGVRVPDELRDGNGSGSIGQLWDPSGGGDVLDNWAPEELDKKLAQARRFRWTVVVALALVGALALVALLILPSLVESQARGLADDYRQALLELNAELGPTQRVLELVTDPLVVLADVGAAGAALSDLSSSATALGTLATEPLPGTLPLIPRGSLDALAPARMRMEAVAADSRALAERMTRIAEYQAGTARLFVTPNLPAVAAPSYVNELSLVLAGVRAETAVVLAGLPDDADLATHKAMARSLQERSASWQTEYLEALRLGDRSTAAGLVNELADLRSELQDEFRNAQAAIRTEIDSAILTLSDEIEATLILVPR